MSDSLFKRGKSLEDEFFKKQSEKQLTERATELAESENVHALAEVSGLDKEEALTKLAKLGVTPDTIAAIALVPLVHVAWADGEMAAREREAIQNAAQDKGIKEDSAAFELLNSWLDAEPPSALFAAWRDYIQGLEGVVDAEHLEALQKSITEFARQVAEAAGGFLGIKAISKDEERAIAEIKDAFPGS